MTTSRPTWGAGVVNHGGFDDLEACLDSLRRQTWQPEQIVVWDTGLDPERLDRVARAHPGVGFLHGSNLGYAGGANRVLEALQVPKAPIEFPLVLNPDVILDEDCAERMLARLAVESEVAIAGGKLLRRDRRTLDSAGIVFPRHRRPRDRGSEEPDRGQYDSVERVEGVSGAAMWLRASELEALSLEGEVFDESFFAYHEDTDLCWRARRMGYHVLYEPAAVAIHARGWKRDERARIPVEIRRHSFKNHYLQLVKNESAVGWLLNAPWLLSWEVLRLGFVLLRDRGLLPAYGEAYRNLGTARRRRKLVSARSSGARRAAVPPASGE